MQAMPDDQRIDVLEKKMDEGFAKIDTRIERGFEEMRAQVMSSERGLRGEISGLRGEIGGLRSEVAAEISSVRGDARSDFRTLIAVVVAMWVATVLTVVGNLPIHL
jgi:hypothetical protein